MYFIGIAITKTSNIVPKDFLPACEGKVGPGRPKKKGYRYGVLPPPEAGDAAFLTVATGEMSTIDSFPSLLIDELNIDTSEFYDTLQLDEIGMEDMIVGEDEISSVDTSELTDLDMSIFDDLPELFDGFVADDDDLDN